MLGDHLLSRRRFLQQSGLAVGMSPLLAGACRADQPSEVSFGFTLYGMRSLPVPDALRACREIGYDSVELACMAEWPSAPETLTATARTELRRQLADWQLKVAGLMENVSPLANEPARAMILNRLRQACVLARDLQPEAPPVIETVLGGKPAEWLQVRDQMATRLQDWARIAEAEKVVIAIKPHVSGALHRPEGAVWLMDRLQSGWLRLAYDYSHFELRGLPLPGSLQAMLPNTAFIHVKDTVGTAEKFQFKLPGDGQTDYAAYFQLLKRAGYRGPLVVEVSGQIHTQPGYDPLAAARSSYTKLAPLLEMAGIRKGRPG